MTFITPLFYQREGKYDFYTTPVSILGGIYAILWIQTVIFHDFTSYLVTFSPHTHVHVHVSQCVCFN